MEGRGDMGEDMEERMRRGVDMQGRGLCEM